MSTPFRVALVGLTRGEGLLNVFGVRPDCEIAVLCDSRPDLVEFHRETFPNAAGCTEFEEVFEHAPDIVVVSTPPAFHAAMSIRALDAGCHVLSEVPAVYSLDECEPLAEAVLRSGKTYMMGENLYFAPVVDTWQRLLDDGIIGDPVYAECEYLHDIGSLTKDNDGKRTWRADLPPLLYPTHDLGPLLMMLRARCTAAVGWQSKPTLGDDFAAAVGGGIFETDIGVPIKFLAVFSTPYPGCMHPWRVFGSKGYLGTQRSPGDQFTLFTDDMDEESDFEIVDIPESHPDAPEEAKLGGHGTSEYFMINAFVRAVAEGVPPPIDVYRALDMTVPGLCAYESAKNGMARVEVPNFRVPA